MLLSVVIPVRDRWESLTECLESLATAEGSTALEVLVVDDGSTERPPPELEGWKPPFEIRWIRQDPLGIAAARNRGVAAASGEVVLFVDSDCIVGRDSLVHLAEAAAHFPDDVAFQAKIVGDSSYMVGRLDHIRLVATQDCQVTPEGHTRYVNTSGFAIRPSWIDGGELFDPRADRGEDTMVLVKLASAGKLPRYVEGVSIEHRQVITLGKFIWKHYRIGYQTGWARDQLAAVPGVLMDSSRRFRTLRLILRRAGEESGGVWCTALILIAYSLELVGRTAHRVRARLFKNA